MELDYCTVEQRLQGQAWDLGIVSLIQRLFPVIERRNFFFLLPSKDETALGQTRKTAFILSALDSAISDKLVLPVLTVEV